MQSIIAHPLSATERMDRSSKPELWIIVALLVSVNLPLLSGGWNHAFTFLPSAAGAGEWWRVFTFPFVHVSMYHLLIDGIAFTLLYSSLSESSIFRRLFLFWASAAGSLLVSVWVNADVQNVGLCGLSGVGHGLMAVCAVEMLSTREKTVRAFGHISFVILFLKCTGEAITGRLVFDIVHLGAVGVPIVVCHAGGMLGALIAVLILKLIRQNPDDSIGNSSN